MSLILICCHFLKKSQNGSYRTRTSDRLSVSSKGAEGFTVLSTPVCIILPPAGRPDNLSRLGAAVAGNGKELGASGITSDVVLRRSVLWAGGGSRSLSDY